MDDIFIWGAGKNLDIVYASIDKTRCNVLGVIDSDKEKQGKLWKDTLKIYSPDVIDSKKFDYIVVSVYKYLGVKAYILSLKIPQKKVLCFWDEDSKNDGVINYIKVTKILENENKIFKCRYYNYPYELGLKKTPIIINAEETLKTIISKNKSLVRFGDGEWDLMFGKKRSWFQKNDKNFAERLREIFASDESSILVGAADDFGNLEKYTESAADDIRDYMMKSRREIETIIDYSRKYYDAYVTRPYIIYKDKAHAKNIFELFKQVWVGKRVLLVEGVMSRIGVGNDLFSSAKSVNRIICPQENCWDRYSAILECAKKYAENADIVCVSLGAAATVLAYDLAKEGYQAIDIGQIDNEYEWYLRKAEKRVSIPGKMVAEVDNKVSFCHDIQGYQEYIASVLEEVK